MTGAEMRTTIRLVSIAIVVGVLSGCGGTTPTPPTSPTPTITSLAVSPQSGVLKPAATVQLNATATRSAGSTQDVTTTASWASSAPDVLRVSAAGLVTAVSDGDASVTASYASPAATTSLSVRTGGQNLEGFVREAAPTAARVIQGAEVVVTAGLYRDARAVSDAYGHFVIADVFGTLDLRVSMNGFEPVALSVTAGGAPLTVQMLPTLTTVTDRTEWNCYPCGDNDYVFDGALKFDLHHNGSLSLDVGASVHNWDSAAFCARLQDVTGGKAIALWARPWQAPVSEQLNLAGGRSYEVSVYPCFWDSGQPMADSRLYWYRIVAVHPP